MKLIVLFILVPLAELALLLILADATHWTVSVGLVLVTGVLGAWMTRGQGVAALQRLSRSMRSGEGPTDSLLDAGLIFMAGAFLLTPGVLTDCFGISLLIPRVRAFYKDRLVAWFKRRFNITTVSSFANPFADPDADPNVVDSFVVEDISDDEGVIEEKVIESQFNRTIKNGGLIGK